MRRRVMSIRLGLARTRHRSQTLVEYGLIAACVAFAGLVGLNALSIAQRAYFTGLPLDRPAPSAPGSILHPTAVDTPVCNTPLKLGTPLMCDAPVVHDTYVDALGGTTDRKPPEGTITVHWDGNPSPYFGCTLGVPPCVAGSKLTWIPTNASLPLGKHTISFWYGYGQNQVAGYPPLHDPVSDHIASKSTELSVTFLLNIKWDVTCVNDLNPGLGLGRVELGRPLRCMAALQDLSSGTAQPVQNGSVTWSTTNTNSVAGLSLFTCSAGVFYPFTRTAANDPSSDPPCQPPMIVTNGAASFTCPPDANGQCEVLYRHLYDSSGGGVPSQSITLNLTWKLDTKLGTEEDTFAFSGIAVVNPGTPHPTNTVVWCTTANPGQVTISRDYVPFDVTKTYRQNKFAATTQIDIQNSPNTTITCTASVADIAPNPSADYANLADPPADANPNNADAHPPMGNVEFLLNGTFVTSCTLVRIDRADLLPAPTPLNSQNVTTQAKGQAPFLSQCTVVGNTGNPGNAPPFALNGTGAGTLTVQYDGEPSSPAHQPSNWQIPVTFDAS